MWTVIFLIFGGLAIDYSYALRTHQLLQASADAASTAGAVQLWEGGAVDTEAIQYARYNMPRGLHGDVLVNNDVFIGTWDHVNKVFTETSINPDAVKVQTRRMASNGNALPTMLLGLVGFGEFDIASESVAQLFMNPACVYNGIIANGIVDMASNNYFDDFCVHGVQGVDLQMVTTLGEYWIGEGGDAIKMPIITVGSPAAYDGINLLPEDQWISGANYQTMLDNNPGLEGNIGVRPDFFSRAAKNVEKYINDLYNADYPTQDQIDTFGPPYTKAEFDALNQDAMSGSYFVACNGGQQISLDPPSKLLSGVTIVADCKINIGAGVTLADTTIATTKTSVNVVTMGNDVTLGADVCDEFGNLTGPPQQSTILSMGDVHTAGGFSVFGSTILSAADIFFAAQSGGISGASIQADGDIILASLGEYKASPCKVPLDETYLAPYWRIVR